MKENKTKYVILGLLNHENCSGYDIKKRIDIALSKFWSAGFGQIYPTLKQLEEEKDIVHIDSTYKFGPERKIYQITEKGKKKLEEWLEIPVGKEDVRYEILLKLFFSAAGEKQLAIRHIEKFKQRNELLLKDVKEMTNELERIVSVSEDHQYYYLTALFGSKIYQAYLDWAEEAEKILNQNYQHNTEINGKGIEKNGTKEKKTKD